MSFDLSSAVHYHHGKFPPENIDYNNFIEPLLKATDALARYDQMLKKIHNSEILLAPLRNQEAVISSRMEGTISTMDEILKYEADHEDDDKSPNVRPDIVETLLYRRALNATQEGLKSGYPFSSSLIKSTHQILLSFGRGAAKSPGEFKIEQNYLADRLKQNILFVPIGPEKLQSGLDALFRYIENSPHSILIKTAIAHVEFEALHPFKDGNGRIGRMLITLMLWKFGVISEPHFYISAYMESNKDQYIDIMRNVSRNNDWNSWCAFFLDALEKQAIKNLEVAEKISSLYEEMKIIFSEILSSKYSVNALDYIFTNPVFRNNSFTSKSGIPTSTAGRFARELLSNNLITIREEASGRRPALYSFEPLMELVRV